MSVVDDGKGFDETTITRPGNGLQNLRRRAADLHAGYEMKSAPGEGTAITLVVPLSGAAIV
jgi:signal transduction histidine kinase